MAFMYPAWILLFITVTRGENNTIFNYKIQGYRVKVLFELNKYFLPETFCNKNG